MPKFRLLLTLPLFCCGAAELCAELSGLLSSLPMFLKSNSFRAAFFLPAAHALAGGSPDSPLMAVVA